MKIKASAFETKEVKGKDETQFSQFYREISYPLMN
jgi:hypothetical protein